MCGPDPAIPASWPVGDPYLRAGGSRPAGPHLQQVFQDPRLQTLIAQALANNRDLMVAAANIAAAREQYQIQRAQQLPTRQRDGRSDASTRRQGRRSSARSINAGCQRAELRARPVRARALADPCQLEAISRDRGRRARDAADPGRRTSPTPGSIYAADSSLLTDRRANRRQRARRASS